MKLTIALFASALALGVAATASAASNEGAPVSAPAGSFQCMSYVRSNHPGVNYTFNYGAPFANVADAKQDAYSRCATDSQARTWAMLCTVHCEQN